MFATVSATKIAYLHIYYATNHNAGLEATKSRLSVTAQDTETNQNVEKE